LLYIELLYIEPLYNELKIRAVPADTAATGTSYK